MASKSFLDHVLSVYSAAREARKPHEAVWDRCLRAYRGEYDFSKRQRWQSKCVLPKIARDVDFISQTVAGAIGDDQQSTFNLVGANEWGKLAAPILEAVIQANLEREGFADNMRGMIVYAQLTPGLVAKVSEVPGPWPGYVTVSPVPYRRLFKDPTGRKGCFIVVTPMDRADALQLCKDNGWDDKAVKAFAENADSDAQTDEQAWLRGCAASIGWIPTDDELRRTVFLLEYWGPAYGNDGERTSEWAYGVIVNKSAVLFGPEDQPFGAVGGRPRKMADVVDGDLVSDPFAVYAKPYIADALGVAEAQQETVNLIIDQAKLQVNAIGLNYDAIEGAGGDGANAIRRIMSEGVAAGVPIPFRGPNPPLVALNLANFSPELLNVMALLDQERQASTGASDIVRGLAASEDTSSQTLGEFQAKQTTGSMSLAAVGKGVEKRFVEPLVELILWHYRNAGFSLLAQPPDLPDVDEDDIEGAQQMVEAAMAQAEEQHSALQAVAGDKIAAAVQEAMDREMAFTPEEALAMLDRACNDEFQVHAAGISAVMDRAESQKKMQSMLEMVAALNAMPAVDRSRTIRTAARLANLDLNDFMMENFEAVLDQQSMMMAEQQAMQQQVMQMAAGQQAMQGPPEQGAKNGAKEGS